MFIGKKSYCIISFERKGKPVGFIKIITGKRDLGEASGLIRDIGMGRMAVVDYDDNRQMIAVMRIAQSLP